MFKELNIGGENMSFDYSKLDGRITEIFSTRGAFAKQMGISERTLSLKMNGKIQWKQEEIHNACGLLKIKVSEIPIYFFTLNVQ
jgi:hypothetical protein